MCAVLHKELGASDARAGNKAVNSEGCTVVDAGETTYSAVHTVQGTPEHTNQHFHLPWGLGGPI